MIIPKINSLDDLFSKTLAYVKKEEQKKIVLFSKDGLSGIKLADMMLEKNINAQLIVLLFPANESAYRRKDDDSIDEFKPNDLNSNSMRNKIDLLHKKGAKVVFGTLPFDNVVVPRTDNAISNSIKSALGLISSGLQLAVQAIMIATDQGLLSDGEEVVSIVGDISIIATSSNSRMLFHPEYGMKILDVIAKR